MNPLILGVAWWLLKPKKKMGKKTIAHDLIVKKTVLADGLSKTLADLVLAQAKVESGNFTSNVFMKTNNAFGYKCYKGSPFQSGCKLKAPEGDYYASYKSLADSVHEITAWLKRRQREGKFQIDLLDTPLKYATALKRVGFYGGTVEAYTRLMNQYYS